MSGLRSSLVIGAALSALWTAAACGDDTLFGSPGRSGGGDHQGGNGGGVSSAGSSADGGGDGGTSQSGGQGGGDGGSAGEGGNWVQPSCSPPCQQFSPYCCDFGMGMPSCQATTNACLCDPEQPELSCIGFFDFCCGKPGQTLGTCTNSRLGCACTPGGNDCDILNVCCDRNDGQGMVCQSNSSGCLCGDDESVCDAFFPICCNKGEGEKCYANNFECQ